MRKQQIASKTDDTDALLTRIANGELLVDISASLNLSHDAVGKRLRKIAPDEYKAARAIGITANLHASRRSLRDAAVARDPVALACAREEFRADSWFAERELPDVYGQHNKVTVEHTGDLGDRLRRAKERTVQGQRVDTVAELPNGAALSGDNADDADSA